MDHLILLIDVSLCTFMAYYVKRSLGCDYLDFCKRTVLAERGSPHIRFPMLDKSRPYPLCILSPAAMGRSCLAEMSS